MHCALSHAFGFGNHQRSLNNITQFRIVRKADFACSHHKEMINVLHDGEPRCPVPIPTKCTNVQKHNTVSHKDALLSVNQRHCTRGREHGLSSQEHLLCLLRTQVQFATPTWWLTTCSRGSNVLFWPPQAPVTCMYTHIGKTFTCNRDNNRSSNENKLAQRDWCHFGRHSGVSTWKYAY